MGVQRRGGQARSRGVWYSDDGGGALWRSCGRSPRGDGDPKNARIVSTVRRWYFIGLFRCRLRTTAAEAAARGVQGDRHHLRNGPDLCDRQAEVVGYTSCAWPLRRSSRRLRIFAVDAYLRPDLLTRHVSSTWYFDRSLMQARYGTVLQLHRLWNRWVTRRRLHAHAPEVAPARS